MKPKPKERPQSEKLTSEVNFSEDDDFIISQRPVAEIEAEIRIAGTSGRKLIREYALALRRELRLPRKEIRKRVFRFCMEEGGWARTYIQHYLPNSLKSLKARRGAARRVETLKQRLTAAERTKAEEYEKVSKALRREYEVIWEMIHRLTGLQIYEQSQIIEATGSNSPLEWNRALVQQTKPHRLEIIKKMTPLDVEHIFSKVQRLYHLLNDYMQQLDEQLNLIHSRKGMTSV